MNTTLLVMSELAMSQVVMAQPEMVQIASTTGGAEADTGGPGFVAFVATFSVVLVTVLLMLDMTRRVRRINYRAKLEHEAQQQTGDAAGPAKEGGAAGRANTEPPSTGSGSTEL